jgi:hypothetical protein
MSRQSLLFSVALAISWAGCARDDDVREFTTGSAPDIAVDREGTAHLVWIRDGRVVATRHEPGADWEPETIIDGGGTDVWLPLTVEVDSEGNAMALWDTGWSNRYIRGLGWGVASPPPASDMTDPNFVLTPGGDAFVVWADRGGPGDRVWVARGVGGNTWESPRALNLASGDNYLACPDVAADAGGSATVVWRQDGSIWASRLEADTWTSPVAIGAAPGIVCPRLVAARDGGAMAVWSVSDGTWASLFVPGAGWESARRIGGHGLIGGVAVDSAGTIMVSWLGYSFDSPGVWAAQFEAGAGWRDAVLVDDAVGAEAPRIAVADGHATIIWSQPDPREWWQLDDRLEYDGPNSVWSAQFDPELGWNEATRLGPSDASPEGASSPQTTVAASSSDSVAAAWSSESADGRIWVHLFSSTTP